MLCVVDIFSKYAWSFPLKDKKGVTIFNTFQSILNDSMKLHPKVKSNKIRVNKGGELYFIIDQWNHG